MNEETLELNCTTDQQDLIDIYSIFNPMVLGYTFFSVAHRTFSKLDHCLYHKESLRKYKEIKTVWGV
jgi:hypothetical protein